MSLYLTYYKNELGGGSNVKTVFPGSGFQRGHGGMGRVFKRSLSNCITVPGARNESRGSRSASNGVGRL